MSSIKEASPNRPFIIKDYRDNRIIYERPDLSQISIKELLEIAVDNRIDMSFASLCYLDLSHANLRSGLFYRANFSYTKLDHADLINVNLLEANMEGANLSHADCRYANLSPIIALQANLMSTDLRYTIFDRNVPGYGKPPTTDKKDN